MGGGSISDVAEEYNGQFEVEVDIELKDLVSILYKCLEGEAYT